MTGSVAVGLADLRVPAGTHLCVFYQGSAGRDQVVLPFLAEGVRAGNKCVCVLDTATPSEVLDKLAAEIDVDQPVATGQLELGTAADAYLSGAGFTPDEMISYWDELNTETARAGTFPVTRATGEMPSAPNWPVNRAEFFRYEARLNEAIAASPQVILCLYDLERFGAGVLMDTLRTHPVVIVDGMAHVNPYYIEPGKFLARRADLE